MQIVIEISDLMFEMLCNSEQYKEPFYLDVTDCTPLPKGHGRLIDADALLSKAKFLYKGYEIALTNTISDAPTIIEADKEAKHGKEIQ